MPLQIATSITEKPGIIKKLNTKSRKALVDNA